MPRNILFVVNPNAGKKISDQIVNLIHAEFPETLTYKISVWENKDDFNPIQDQIRSGDYTDVIAVGGDGTVNRVAQTVLGTEIRLGIIPLGSGNGLARSLKISMNVQRCLHQIADGRSALIDSGTVNGHPFFCTSGAGFDAHIGQLFASSIKRGLRSYVRIIARELFLYRAKSYELHINGQVYHRKAFLITVANAGQYGNDFYIAPQADMQDGLFHIVVLKPFNVLKVGGLLTNILKRKAYLSKSIETFTASSLEIVRESEDSLHFDGEPAFEAKTLRFENLKGSLNVLVGEGFGVSSK
jgi:YegS/Rv2252/BmrU family lipid kinase